MTLSVENNINHIELVRIQPVEQAYSRLTNVGIALPYAEVALPRGIPAIHPYNPLGSEDGRDARVDNGVSQFSIACRLGELPEERWPQALRPFLDTLPQPVGPVQFAIATQNNPWNPQHPLLFRPQPWLHPNAPGNSVIAYQTQSNICVAMADVNSAFSAPINLGASDVVTHTEPDGGLVVYSGNNMGITGDLSGEQSHVFYSVCVNRDTQEVIVTLHGLLCDDDHRNLQVFMQEERGKALCELTGFERLRYLLSQANYYNSSVFEDFVTEVQLLLGASPRQESHLTHTTHEIRLQPVAPQSNNNVDSNNSIQDGLSEHDRNLRITRFRASHSSSNSVSPAFARAVQNFVRDYASHDHDTLFNCIERVREDIKNEVIGLRFSPADAVRHPAERIDSESYYVNTRMTGGPSADQIEQNPEGAQLQHCTAYTHPYGTAYRALTTNYLVSPFVTPSNVASVEGRFFDNSHSAGFRDSEVLHVCLHFLIGIWAHRIVSSTGQEKEGLLKQFMMTLHAVQRAYNIDHHVSGLDDPACAAGTIERVYSNLRPFFPQNENHDVPDEAGTFRRDWEIYQRNFIRSLTDAQRQSLLEGSGTQYEGLSAQLLEKLRREFGSESSYFRNLREDITRNLCEAFLACEDLPLQHLCQQMMQQPDSLTQEAEDVPDTVTRIEERPSIQIHLTPDRNSLSEARMAEIRAYLSRHDLASHQTQVSQDEDFYGIPQSLKRWLSRIENEIVYVKDTHVCLKIDEPELTFFFATECEEGFNRFCQHHANELRNHLLAEDAWSRVNFGLWTSFGAAPNPVNRVNTMTLQQFNLNAIDAAFNQTFSQLTSDAIDVFRPRWP